MDRPRSACQDGATPIARPGKGGKEALGEPETRRDDNPIALYHADRPAGGFLMLRGVGLAPPRIKGAIAQHNPSDFRVRQSSRFSPRNSP